MYLADQPKTDLPEILMPTATLGKLPHKLAFRGKAYHKLPLNQEENREKTPLSIILFRTWASPD